MTNNNPKTFEYENLGYYYTTTTIERNTHLLHLSPENVEKKHLNDLKKGKDECLIRLSDEIKKAERVLIGPKGSGKSYKSEQLDRKSVV